MLVVFYIISAVSGVVASIFIEKRNLKRWFTATIIAFLFGIAFCIPMTKKIVSDLYHINFWSIFAVLSLIAWQLAFIFNNSKNLANYEFAFLLFSFVIYVFCSSFFYSNYLVTCFDTHVSTEIFPIVITIDGTESPENITEDVFVVERIMDISSNKFFYQYSIQHENGNISIMQSSEKSTTVVPIADSESPYVEITTTRHCSGYRRETLEHSLTYADKIYILYIPEGSIKNVLRTN